MSNGALQAVAIVAKAVTAARAAPAAIVVLEYPIYRPALSIKIVHLISMAVVSAQSTISASGARPALLTASIVTVTQLAQ